MTNYPTEADFELIALVSAALREPISYERNGTGLRLTFEPPLTPEEQAVYDSLLGLSRSAVQVTPVEWAGLRTELDGLRAYHALATPTAAQTAQATKAIIRVLRAILRD